MGARIVPEAQGKWIGNLDILKRMMENLKIGYPGIFPFSNCQLETILISHSR
jgi:hypothetical protein